MDFIQVWDDVLDADFCAGLIDKFEADGRMNRGVTGEGVDVSKKDSWDIQISSYPEWREETAAIIQSLSVPLCEYMQKYDLLLTGAVSPTIVHPETGEPTVLDHANFSELGRDRAPALMNTIYRCGLINLQKYRAGEGGYHHWHSEVFPQRQGTEALHRVLLWQFYLNDVSAGGETTFLYQSRQVAARRGRLVIAPAGFTHSHRGEVPRDEDKYILTSWVLFRTAQTLYGEVRH